MWIELMVLESMFLTEVAARKLKWPLVDTRLFWNRYWLINWFTLHFFFIIFFAVVRNRETAKRSRKYSASVPEIWYQKLWHGIARCCRRRLVFKKLFPVSTCLQSFARVSWCTAVSPFRKTCFADKKKTLERARVCSFNALMSVVHLRFYRLAVSYKNET